MLGEPGKTCKSSCYQTTVREMLYSVQFDMTAKCVKCDDLITQYVKRLYKGDPQIFLGIRSVVIRGQSRAQKQKLMKRWKNRRFVSQCKISRMIKSED